MRGRKRKLENVVPIREFGGAEDEARVEASIRRAIKALQPRGLSPEMKKEWKRVARILAEPSVDRLKARYVDVIQEYCVVCIRIRAFREAMPTINKEIYDASQGGAKKTRNGIQIKTHPYVPQLNEAWRQWRSLVAILGLSPTDERNLQPGQGDPFDKTERYFNS